MQRHAVDVDMFAQDIPGSTGDVSDNGAVLAGQGIEQTGLAGVGSTGDDHIHAIAQQGALTRFPLYLLQVALYLLQLGQHMPIG